MNFEGVYCGFPTRETKLGSFEGLLKIPLFGQDMDHFGSSLSFRVKCRQSKITLKGKSKLASSNLPKASTAAQKINIDNNPAMVNLKLRLIGVSICCAEADTQFATFHSSALKKQLYFLGVGFRLSF